MKIKIKSTKINLDPEMKVYIQDKMDMLDKYLGSVQATNCDVEVGLAVGSQHSGKIYQAEVNLSLPGEMLRVTKTEKELKKAIDKVKDHLTRSIKRYKEKRLQKKINRIELTNCCGDHSHHIEHF